MVMIYVQDPYQTIFVIPAKTACNPHSIRYGAFIQPRAPPDKIMIKVSSGDVVRVWLGGVLSVQTVKWVDDKCLGTFSGLCLSRRDVAEIVVKGDSQPTV